MSTLLAFSVLVELTGFLVFDYLKNSRRFSKRYFLRLVSGTTGSLLVVMELIPSMSPGIDNLAAATMTSCGILCLSPLSFEKPILAFRASIFMGGTVVLASIALSMLPPGWSSFKAEKAVVTVFSMMPAFIYYYVSAAVRRFKGIRLFFRNVAVWHSMEDYSRFLYTMAFLCLCMLALCVMPVPGDAGLVLEAVCLLLCMGLYPLLYLRSMTGKTFILEAGTEMRVKDIIKGNLRTSFIDKAEEDRKMNSLYQKVMLYMAEEKPYLDPSFCMDDMTGKVYSNKLYLSRTINILSGRNFRQFVNYHRVQYAMSLFKKDPRLKVSEVAEMSGFNSGVSFNMAFKVNTGMTPSEWFQEHVNDRNE